MMDEYFICLTLELDESRTSTTLSMLSFESAYSDRCLRSIAAKGAPTHFSSTLSDCTITKLNIVRKTIETENKIQGYEKDLPVPSAG